MTPETFEDVTLSAGLTYDTGEILSVAWVDFNADGWLDLWLGNHFGFNGELPYLYLNRGDGTFENRILAAWSADPLADTHGAAWADYDNDGDPDLLELVGGARGYGQGKNLFHENRGGRLVERAVEVGLAYPRAQGRMPTWWDWDRDGQLDAILTSFASRPVGEAAPTTVFRQDAGVFFDRGQVAGIRTSRDITRVQLAEVTGDDVLDLLFVSSMETPHRIYSLSDGSVEDVTSSLMPRPLDYVADVTTADFNGDLRADFYVLRWGLGRSQVHQVNDTLLVGQFSHGGTLTFYSKGAVSILDEQPQRHAILAGIPVFTGRRAVALGMGHDQIVADPADSTVWGVGKAQGSTGIVVGVDPQTHLWTVRYVGHRLIRQARLVITASQPISRPEFLHFRTFLSLDDVFEWSQGRRGFRQRSFSPRGGTPCTSAVAGDFDNDMDVDLYLSCAELIRNRPNLLLENLGNGRFEPVPQAGGAIGDMVGLGFEDMSRPARVIAADYDNDGFLDLLVAGTAPWHARGRRIPEAPIMPTVLFRNRGNSHHWLQVDLVGTASNRDGIGARVFVTVAETTQLREQSGGGRTYAQDPMRLHFGLAEHRVVDRLEVRWPSGTIQVLEGVPADQIIVVTEPVTQSPERTPPAAALRGRP